MQKVYLAAGLSLLPCCVCTADDKCCDLWPFAVRFCHLVSARLAVSKTVTAGRLVVPSGE